MRFRRLLPLVAVLVLGIAWSAAPATVAEAAGTAVVTDFAAAPTFSFLAWEKKAAVEGGALRIQAPSDQGGVGYSIKTDLSAFAERTPALTVTVGAGNKAKSILVSLSDADGTKHDYFFKLEGLAAGATATVTADDGASLKEPAKVGAAGKQAGLDLAEIVQLVVQGAWSSDPIDVTVRRLELVEPDPAILKAREALREKLAKAEAERRQAEEQKAKRKQELLAGAPHPADGPAVRHVAPVAPDILALSIQEKEFVPVPQVPYEAKPGDEIKHTGKETVLVVEDGKVQEALKDVVVVRQEGGKEVTLGYLAINAKRLKPEDKATGQDLATEKAVTSYARLPDGQGDAALRQDARQAILTLADTALAFADGNAFGVTMCIPTLPPIGWIGYLSTPETAVGAVLPHAWLLTGDPKYLAGAVRACQFAAGANPDNRALTTGLGPDPVRFPLHIDSAITGQPAPAGITVYGISDPAENYGFDGWAYTWFLQKMVPPSRIWPTHESYWDIYVVPSTNEFTIHQTIIPTAFYWGFLAAREAPEARAGK